MEKKNAFTITRARPEDAAALLDYLKIVGGETDNLSFGAEGVPLAPRRVRHQPEAGVVGLRCGLGPDGGRPCLCAGKRLSPARYRGAQRQYPRHPAV